MALSEVRKTVVNVLTLVVTAGPWVLDALHVLPGGTSAAVVLSSVLGVAGAILHYLVPNVTDDPVVANSESVALRTSVSRRARRKSTVRKPDSGHTQTH